MDLFYEIKRMADRPAGCFARVKYFAGKFGVCVRTIKGWLRKLKDQGLLKVEHHGSSDEGLGELLRLVRPKIALISVGEGNDYGHPAPSTLSALTSFPGLELYRTDEDGRITVESDGTSFSVRTER